MRPFATSLDNAGALTLDSTAALSLQTYTQEASGILTVGVAGTSASGDLGTLSASGTATVAGTLGIVTDPPFVPAVGDQYTPISAATLDGTFTSVTGTTVNSSTVYSVAYTATSVELNVVDSSVDLQVESVTGPTSAFVGGPLTVGWTVTALTGTAPAGWTDSVYASPTPSLTAASVLLGNVVHNSSLSAGNSYQGSLATTAPGLASGPWYFVVVTDSRDQLADANRANNLGASSPATITITALAPGTPDTGTIPAGGDVYVQVNPVAGTNLVITATFSSRATASMFEAFGHIPSPSRFDEDATDPSAASQVVVLSDAQATPYYIDLDNPTSTDVPYTLGAVVTDLAVTSVTPTKVAFVKYVPAPKSCVSNGTQIQCTGGPDRGRLQHRGGQFPHRAGEHGAGDRRHHLRRRLHPSTTVSLSCSGLSTTPTTRNVPATSSVFVSGTELYADFGPAFSGTGTCAVDVATATDTAGLPSAITFTQVEATEGDAASEQALFTPQVSIDTPSINRPNLDSYATVDYKNPFPYEIPAPLMELTATGATLHLTDEPGGDDNTVLLLGASPTGNPAFLAPGASGSIEVVFDSTLGAHQDVDFTLDTLNDPSGNFDLGAALSSMLPPNTSAAVANYVATTAGVITGAQLQTLLGGDAGYLSTVGSQVTDGFRLLEYELSKLDNYGSVVTDHTNGPFGFGLPGLVDQATADAAGNVVITDPTGLSTVFLIRPSGGYVAAPGVRSTLKALPAGGWVLADPNGSTATFNAAGQVTSSTDGYGQISTYTYSGGELTTISDPDNNVYNFSYDAAGDVNSWTDGATGQAGSYTYDQSGRMTSQTEEGTTTSYTWNSSANQAIDGTLASVTQPDGVSLAYTYDGRGRLVEIARSDGAEQEGITYPSDGVAEVTSAGGNTTTEDLNEDGVVVRAVLPDGTPESTTVDAQGDQTANTLGDLSNHFTYDSSGNLTSGTTPLGNTNLLTYSQPGVLSGFTEPMGQQTTITRNAATDPTEILQPDGTATSFVYSPTGRLLSATDRGGEETQYSYDATGKVSSEKLADGTTRTFTYDGHGNLLTATNPAGTTTYTYDGDDQMTSVTYPTGLGITYTYDVFGRRSSVTTSDGYKVAYGYDSAGRLTSLSDGGGATIVSYTYTPGNEIGDHHQRQRNHNRLHLRRPRSHRISHQPGTRQHSDLAVRLQPQRRRRNHVGERDGTGRDQRRDQLHL